MDGPVLIRGMSCESQVEQSTVDVFYIAQHLGDPEEYQSCLLAQSFIVSGPRPPAPCAEGIESWNVASQPRVSIAAT